MNPFRNATESIVIDDNNNKENNEPISKKRKADEITPGETITQEDAKRIHFNPEDLEADSNTCTFLRLESDPDLFGCKELIFNPEYTNQIFGEEEKIKGYRNLQVNIHMTSGNLYAYLDIASTYKAPDATDIQTALVDNCFLQGLVESKDDFIVKMQEEKSFKPYGTRLKEYNGADSSESYEIYHCTFGTPGFKAYNKRLQVFLLFLIDAASYLDDNEENWDYYIIYRKSQQNIYTIVGYTTVYNFYQSTKKKRTRISQFLILPPFQRKQHGTQLLNFIYERAENDPICYEITVEDSGDEFQLLRDYCNVLACLNTGFFFWVLKYKNKSLTLQDYKLITLTQKEITDMKAKLKLSKLQITRVFEILKLALISDTNEDVLRKFRDDVKRRLYLLNRAEFLPFKNKKIPYIEIDGERQMYTPGIFEQQNKKLEEIDARLEDYCDQIEDDYVRVLPRIKKFILSSER